MATLIDNIVWRVNEGVSFVYLHTGTLNSIYRHSWLEWLGEDQIILKDVEVRM